MTMKASEFLYDFGNTLISVARIILKSRHVGKFPKKKNGDKIIILANGPSLRKTIEENEDLIKNLPTLAVNFMANTPEFSILRPDYYVLADPHFFNGTQHENVMSLWEHISDSSWPMTLCVPATMKSKAEKLIGQSKNISICTFNFVGVEGFGWFEKLAYRLRMGMPRPRNVLVPSIMTAIAAGYKEIYLCGADHSWLETIRVTDENHVVSVQPHFYVDSSKELTRSEKEYQDYHLHDIIKSFYIAFRSYHSIANYIRKSGIKVYNSTPGSFIDAFPRRSVSELTL